MKSQILTASFIALSACSARPEAPSERPEGEQQARQLPGCDPVNVCRVPRSVGGACGQVSAGCPGKFQTCTCEEGLLCVDSTCVNAPSPSVAEITAAFQLCDATPNVGQSAEISGVTCAEVCNQFGFQACVQQNHQPGPEACAAPTKSAGTCEDRVSAGDFVECVCAVGE